MAKTSNNQSSSRGSVRKRLRKKYGAQALNRPDWPMKNGQDFSTWSLAGNVRERPRAYKEK